MLSQRELLKELRPLVSAADGPVDAAEMTCARVRDVVCKLLRKEASLYGTNTAERVVRVVEQALYDVAELLGETLWRLDRLEQHLKAERQEMVEAQ